MTQEFNLSEKIDNGPTCQDTIEVKDVKEFIKRLNNLIVLLVKGDISFTEFVKRRDKLAGDKLK